VRHAFSVRLVDRVGTCRFQTSRGLTRFPYPELEHSPTSYLTRHGYAHVGDGTLGIPLGLRSPL
jgi:hypothetical protein